MPTREEQTQVQRNATALMLAALQATDGDHGAELLAQISHLDLIPVVMLLAHLGAALHEQQHGSREQAIAALEEQLLHLAARHS